MGQRLSTRLGTPLGTRLGTSLSADGAGPAPPASIAYGIRGWNGSDLLGTAQGAGNRGSVAGFWMGAVVRPDALPVGNQVICGPLDGSGKGAWLASFGTAFSFNSGNAAGNAVVQSPPRTIVAGDVGKTHAVMGVHMGSVGLRVRLIWNGAEVGAPGAVTDGYTLPQAGVRDQLGLYGGGSGIAVNWTIVGYIGGNGVPTLGEITDWFAAVKVAGTVVAIPGKTVHTYAVPVLVPPAAPSTIVDPGGQNMAFWNGSAAGLIGDAFAPVWAY